MTDVQPTGNPEDDDDYIPENPDAESDEEDPGDED